MNSQEKIAPSGKILGNPINPQLSVRRCQGEEEIWQPIYVALNLPLINEFASDFLFGTETVWDRIGKYCAMANLPKPAIPIAAEREMVRREAAEMERIRLRAEKLTAMKRMQEELEAGKQRNLAKGEKWGTKEAKRREIERVRRDIEAKKN